MTSDRQDSGHRDILEALQGVLQESSEPVAVLEAILRQAVRRTGAERGLIAEVLEGGEIRFGVLMGFRENGKRGDAGGFSRTLFDHVLRTGRTMRIENALLDPIFSQMESVRALHATALLGMPLRVAGRIVALLHLEDARPGHFVPAHVELLSVLLAVAEPALGALRAARDRIEERDHLRSSESQQRHEAEAERRWMASEWSFGRFIGRSPAIHELEQAVKKAAATEFPVLLLGEPGTGKTLLAHVLHYSGPRSTGPFITVSCPNLERGMVEAELFGHKQGAFTGASSDRHGRVQAADGGTLFLDEVGELPVEIQPKLLRFLQDRGFERVGDPRELKADVRIIAATNRDLALDVQQGRFRRDLFDRLNFLPIRVPPLRQRVEDIPRLLRHSLDQSPAGRWIQLTTEATTYLESLDFSWPGNMRDVEHLAARLATEGLDRPATVLDVTRLLDAPVGDGPDDEHSRMREADLEVGLPRLLEEAERAWIEEALSRYPDLSRAELAAKLRISEAALYRKLRRYRLGE
jgi:transcriptional regulator with GAF, ATPase, and Fis domain